MAYNHLSLVVVGLLLVVWVACKVYATVTGPEDVPSHLPWVGVQKGIFPRLRARFASVGGLLSTLESGYAKYSRSGLSFVLPGFDKPMVIVPASEVKWMAEQPADVLSAHKWNREVVQTDWTLLDQSLARNPLHDPVIRRDLTRNLGSLIPDVEEELSFGVEQFWGADTENWTEVGVFDTMMKIVARTSNRIFVGLPLCRNEEYLHHAGEYAGAVAISSVLVRLIPAFLRPVLAWIPLLPNRYHLYKCSKFLLPFIRSRLAERAESACTGEKFQHNDFTSWLMDEALKSPDPTEQDPHKIVKRIMVINFAAIHTSTFTATNMLFDLFSCPTAGASVVELREEVESVLAANGNHWDKHAIAKLVKIDSAVRESLRVSTFMSHGMGRIVQATDGVTLSDGLHLPYGTRVGTSTYSIHHDDAIYIDAKTYDPLRFSRARETADSVLDGKNLATVTTSETFLSFGHGRSACPGRFFAAMEMKLLLAFVLLNYDIQFLTTRPENAFMGGSIVPPLKEKLSVRRRVV